MTGLHKSSLGREVNASLTDAVLFLQAYIRDYFGRRKEFEYAFSGTWFLCARVYPGRKKLRSHYSDE